MERFEHGGDVYRHPGALDFSASLNPLGMPHAAAEVLRAQVDAFARYPDPAARELTEAIAAYEQVPPSQVLACAGATDALARLCQVLRPKRALVCAPCYVGYEHALSQAGIAATHHGLSPERDFQPTFALVEAITTDVGLVFLANPNNPTGRCLDRSLLRACLDQARATGATVVLDECFVDLTPEPGSNDLLSAYHNLVIVKAFTKTFALAGLRVGYVLSADRELLHRLAEAGLPWALSVPAQLAGVACARLATRQRSAGDDGVCAGAKHASGGDAVASSAPLDTGPARTARDASGGAAVPPTVPRLLAAPTSGYLAESRRLVAAEGARMAAALRALGCHVVPSQANYLLFRAHPGLVTPLLAHGVLVRCCDNFRGLDARWYRVAVRLPEENDRLLAALGEVLASWHDHS